jgi:hypothetical protein
MILDIFEPLNSSIKILQKLQICPVKDPSRREIFRIICIHLLLVDLSVILQSIYLVKDARNYVEIVSTLVTLPIQIIVGVEVLLLAVDFPKILDLMELIKKCVDESGISEEFERNISEAKRIFRATFVNGIVAATFASLVPFIDHKLSYQMWLPFDPNNSFVFWFAAVYQIIAIYFDACEYLSMIRHL